MSILRFEAMLRGHIRRIQVFNYVVTLAIFLLLGSSTKSKEYMHTLERRKKG